MKHSDLAHILIIHMDDSNSMSAQSTFTCTKTHEYVTLQYLLPSCIDAGHFYQF